MRLCSIVNMHVVVESCPLCECLLTLVATVRSLTAVHSLMSPGGMNNFRVPFSICLFSGFSLKHISEKRSIYLRPELPRKAFPQSWQTNGRQSEWLRWWVTRDTYTETIMVSHGCDNDGVNLVSKTVSTGRTSEWSFPSVLEKRSLNWVFHLFGCGSHTMLPSVLVFTCSMWFSRWRRALKALSQCGQGKGRMLLWIESM